MKTKIKLRNQISQLINNSQNQKVMKTKKYSNSMKALVTLGIMFMISSAAYSQTIEERKGGTSTYSVAASAGTDEYTWVISADVAPVSVTPGASSGSGTTADPWIINWTADLTSIDVEWGADASPDIASTPGVVTVQKRTTVGAVCPSPVQTMDIAFWSEPDASIDPVAFPPRDVCSTDPITGTITIDLAGAPDGGQSGGFGFDVVYDVAVSDALLTVTGPNGGTGNGQTVSSDGATVTIPLPDALVNADNVAHTYTITLQTIDDDLDDGPHAIPPLSQVYTITVHPTPATGIINSTGALGRR